MLYGRCTVVYLSLLVLCSGRAVASSYAAGGGINEGRPIDYQFPRLSREKKKGGRGDAHRGGLRR